MNSPANPLHLSSVGFGAWEAGGGTTWGPNSSRQETIAAINAAFDAGVNWIDTAEVYGGGGGSEELVGAAISDHPGIKVCTKVAPEPESHFTKRGMRAALQASLARLGRDAIDIYMLHWPADTVTTALAWESLVSLKIDGLVGATGLSNFPAADVSACAASGELDYVQIQASLLYRDELAIFAPLCKQLDIGLITYGSLAFGMLSGGIDEQTELTDWRGGQVMSNDFFCAENYRRWFAKEARARHLATIAELHEVAAGCSLAQLALRWLLDQPGVTAALVGTRDPRHAHDNATTMRTSLSPLQLRRVEAIVHSAR